MNKKREQVENATIKMSDMMKIFPPKYTIEEKVLKNVIEDMEKEVKIFENVYDKDDDFYSDWANESYVLHLNNIARLKEVLFRMNINNKESA